MFNFRLIWLTPVARRGGGGEGTRDTWAIEQALISSSQNRKYCADIVVVTLIRTDTTLDHSQVTEKV